MLQKILWECKAYQSLENCFLKVTENGAEANSIIIGHHNDIIYHVEYFLKTNKNWETVMFQIKSNLNGFVQSFAFENFDQLQVCRANNSLKYAGVHCDIDISLTPFTNTLPINALLLKKGQTKNLRVLYFDILNQQTQWVQQTYTRLSKFTYKFQNIPNEFEAVITVDEHGLVTNYPELFERKAMWGQ